MFVIQQENQSVYNNSKQRNEEKLLFNYINDNANVIGKHKCFKGPTLHK